MIKRQTDIWELFAQGIMPSELDQIGGELEVFADSIVHTSQARDDVYRCIAMGGGGYGDPLDRDPESVLRDVIAGVVSVEHARLRYGVVIDPAGRGLDAAATTRRREEIREERRASAQRPNPGSR